MLASNEEAEFDSNRARKEFVVESGMERLHDSMSIKTLRKLSNRRPRSEFDRGSPHETLMKYLERSMMDNDGRGWLLSQLICEKMDR